MDDSAAVEPPSAQEFNRTIRGRLGPRLLQLGYAAEKSSPAWSRNAGHEKVGIRFRRHPNAVDPYQGGRFQVEFDHSSDLRPGTAFSGRARLDQLMRRTELQRVLALQNDIIASLPRPPSSHVNAYPESLRATYLRGFQPQGHFSPGDLWLRYHTVEDLERWTDLITELMDALLERAEQMDPEVVYAGTEIDLNVSPLRSVRP